MILTDFNAIRTWTTTCACINALMRARARMSIAGFRVGYGTDELPMMLSNDD